MRHWAKIAAVLVCGYGLFGRTFAYIGIPPAKLFIGDVVLALFLICCTGAVLHPWLEGVLRPTPFSELYWTLLLFLCYGVLQLARGLAQGYEPLPAIQELVFNVYPLYFFLGVRAGLAYPGVISRIVRFLVLASCIGGLVFYLFLRNVHLMLPGTDIDLIGMPGGAGMALIGMTFLDLRRWWPAIGISAFFVLASQVRGGWLGLGLALLLQSILTKQITRLMASGAFVVGLLLIGFWTDVRIPSPAGRGGSIASGELIARAVAAVDRDAAREFGSRNNVNFYAGTVGWRKLWWRQIWASAHSDIETALLGHGYGYPLHNLVPYLRHEEDLRTPHSVFYFALGYTGWIGVILFFGFQAALVLTLWRAWRAGGQPFGLVLWVVSIAGGIVGNSFETPFGAIPFYLLTGMAAADILNSSWVEVERPVRTQFEASLAGY